MRPFSLAACVMLIAAASAPAPALALKRVPYPDVKVIALPGAEADPALAAARKRFAEAVQARNLDAVLGLVAPSFEWTAGGVIVDEFDAKRGAAHNFRVAFGFRPFGRDADGPTDIGPQWDLLAFFANDPIATQEKGSPLVCGSVTAKPADLAILDEAFNRIDEESDLSEWVYAVEEIELTDKPGGAGMAKVKSAAFPILGVHPAQEDDAKEPAAPTHFELLLPDGQAGWTPVGNVRPLFADRLCFGKAGSEWKIAAYDQAE